MCTSQPSPSRPGGGGSWPGGGPSAGVRLLTQSAGTDLRRCRRRRRRHVCFPDSHVFISYMLRFIKGFIYRHKERCPENEYFLDYVRYSFLMNLHRNLPKSVLDKSWPTPPAALTEVETDVAFTFKTRSLCSSCELNSVCVCVFRRRSICVNCACRTWCGATARRSAPSGSTR